MSELKKTGIYKISNKENNKSYIGSAAGKYGIYQRFCDHKKHLRRNSHHNRYLQRAWNKYGEDNFEFEVIEYCDKAVCIAKEQEHLDKEKPEYNICKTAGNTLGINCEEYMDDIAILAKRKKQSKNISLALSGKKKSDDHAIKCGAKVFNAYRAITVKKRKRGQSAEYKKGELVGRWLKRSDCSDQIGVDSKFIARCLSKKRHQACGYIFEYEAT